MRYNEKFNKDCIEREYRNFLIFNFFKLIMCFFKNSNFWYIFFLKKSVTIYNFKNFDYFLSIVKDIKNLFTFQFFDLLLNFIVFIQMRVEGLYYRVKYYEKVKALCFLVGYHHYMVFFLPEEVNVLIHTKKRRFVLYGFDKLLLTKIVTQIESLDAPTLFKNKGIKIASYNYRYKKFKKKR